MRSIFSILKSRFVDHYYRIQDNPLTNFAGKVLGAHKRMTTAKFYIRCPIFPYRTGPVLDAMNRNFENLSPAAKQVLEECTRFANLVSTLFCLLASSKETRLHPNFVKVLASFLIKA